MESKLKIVHNDGLLLTSDITEPFIRTLSTLGDGEVIEKAAENMSTAFRNIVDGECDKATITLTLEISKSKDDNQLFKMQASTRLSIPAKKCISMTFVGKDFTPERNRTEETKYHSRGL